VEKVPFGKTNLSVSKLCFGTLTCGPLQAKMKIADAVSVMEHAWDRGINFFDSAELYGTQGYIGNLPPHIRHSAVITTKSYSDTKDKMTESVEKSLREMRLDAIPIYLLHEQETEMTFMGHKPALETLLDFKHRGLIKSVGVSTHTIEITKLARSYPEIEVIFPMFNLEGWGIKDGTQEQMEQEVKLNYQAGLGVYLMKVLAGGKLLHRAREAIEYGRDFPYSHSVAIGMKDKTEVDYNIALFENREPDAKISEVRRKMLVSFWCEGCGECVKACPQNAISIVDGRASIDPNKCVLCTYCVGCCPKEALRVI